MVLGAYLYGLQTVGECLKDETVSAFLKKCLFDEIVPTLGNTRDRRPVCKRRSGALQQPIY